MGEMLLIKLLIVDDDTLFLNGLIKHIDWKNFDIEVVSIAGDGAEALELSRVHKPHIILTDVRMPKMNGIELATKVREEMPECQIIFMSIYSDKNYLKMAIRVRAIDYIEKPVDKEELESVLLRAIEFVKQNQKIEQSGKKNYSRTVEDIMQFILDNYAKDFTIEFLANHVYLSPNYLCNVFKKETGKTINQFMTEIRIGKSCEMIINTHKSMLEIANAIGYSDQRHYSKIFQKVVGKTPSEFRRQSTND